jgi:hypothetical protein
MKHLIHSFFILLISLSSTILSAQDTKVGVKAGVNYTTITGDDANNVDAQWQYHGGLFVHINLTENLIFQPEALYSRQGADLNEGGELDLSYLNVPLLIKFKFAERFGVYAGPQFGVIMKAQTIYDDPNGKEITADSEDQFSTFDIGGAFGFEVDLPFNLKTGARYVVSFPSIGEDYQADFDATGQPVPSGTIPAADLKNSVIQAYVGIGF